MLLNLCRCDLDDWVSSNQDHTSLGNSLNVRRKSVSFRPRCKALRLTPNGSTGERWFRRIRRLEVGVQGSQWCGRGSTNPQSRVAMRRNKSTLAVDGCSPWPSAFSTSSIGHIIFSSKKVPSITRMARKRLRKRLIFYRIFLHRHKSSMLVASVRRPFQDDRKNNRMSIKCEIICPMNECVLVCVSADWAVEMQ